MDADELFWHLAEELYVDDAVTRSTMFGFPCLRVDGDFFASLHHSEHHLIVKLPAERVNELVATGAGLSFAPNGRVFREWVAIPEPNQDAWRAYLAEARDFVSGRNG